MAALVGLGECGVVWEVRATRTEGKTRRSLVT